MLLQVKDLTREKYSAAQGGGVSVEQPGLDPAPER